jgi:hypothetical protein
MLIRRQNRNRKWKGESQSRPYATREKWSRIMELLFPPSYCSVNGKKETAENVEKAEQKCRHICEDRAAGFSAREGGNTTHSKLMRKSFMFRVKVQKLEWKS